jgi:hypothetical protein
MGALYIDLREQRIPHVITLDALFSVVHLGLVRALAEVEELALAPALQTLLEKLDGRLATEEAGASTELVDAYRIARGVVAVARGLATTTPQSTSPDLAKVVAEERARIEDHAGMALSSAERSANDEALSTEEASALAAIPARIAKLEEASGADDGPVVAVVHADPTSRRLLASATSRIEPALMLIREPAKDEPILVVGAHVAHHELVESFDPNPGGPHTVRPTLTDASWRARLKGSASPVGPSGAATSAPERAPVGLVLPLDALSSASEPVSSKSVRARAPLFSRRFSSKRHPAEIRARTRRRWPLNPILIRTRSSSTAWRSLPVTSVASTGPCGRTGMPRLLACASRSPTSTTSG